MYDEAIAHLSQHDPILANVINAYDPPSFQKHTNYYQELVESIISQQLSVKAAASILKRFVDHFGGSFPSPEKILETDIETFRSLGLSRPKASYIRDLAERVYDGRVSFDHLDTLSNDEIITELTAVKGVGVWTVHMFLMFCMGRLDVLAYGDLGIRNGIKQLYDLDRIPDQAEVERIAEINKWHPYETVACWYIWRSLENTPAL